MRKGSEKIKLEKDDMRTEYDLKNMSGGVQGKYHKAYSTGHTVKINKTNGTILVQNFKLDEGTVSIEPDVRKHFPDAEAVNNALRCLIPLISKKRKVKARKPG